MKRVAVVLSGCGVFDGAEIHESVLTLLALSKAGIVYQVFAPDKNQYHTINHINGQVIEEKRNVLVEASRIARGNIKALSEYKAEQFDGIIFPGGYGVAKNLCTFAVDGVNFKVDPEVERVILETHRAGKPIGALCISPVLIAKVINESLVTIGKDRATAEIIQQLNGRHIETDNTGIAIDKENKIVTTPCYMLDSSIAHIAEGIEKLVKAMMELSGI